MSSVEEGKCNNNNGVVNNGVVNNGVVNNAVESPYEEVRPTKKKSVCWLKVIAVILCIVGVVVAFILLIYIAARLVGVDQVSR